MMQASGRSGRWRPARLLQTIAADRELQDEIDKALESLCGPPPRGGADRVMRVLNIVLRPSWAQHTSFQDEALFPIIARSRGPDAETQQLLDGLRSAHTEITARQHTVSIDLNRLVAGWPGEKSGPAKSIAHVVALRRGHSDAEVALATMLPSTLEDVDQALLETWSVRQSHLRFPADMLLDLWD